MKRTIIMVFLTVLACPRISSQNTVKGRVLDADTGKPISGVFVQIQKLSTTTNTQGIFILKPLIQRNLTLRLHLKAYENQQFLLNLKGKDFDLGTILLAKKIEFEQDISTISLSDDELSADSNSADNISGLLQSSKDVYLRAAAFEFSSSFFKVRGLDSENATLLINGIEMNKIYNGRPQWSDWGGLNTVMRDQVFNEGLDASSVSFGGILGTTNIVVRASEARPGGTLSYASSNRSYVHRILASYASGMVKNGWAYTVSASRRAATEGFSDGTFYDANSLFIAVEKKLNEQHSLNFTGFITPNKRGKSSPNTQEVFSLKGIAYNSYWGLQNGKIRNSRTKEIIEPFFMLNHYWTMNDKLSLNTNIAYQTGKVGNTRIDYNGSKLDENSNGNPAVVSLGGANPDPTYYQQLPSYGLRQGYPNVYEMEQHLLEDGQLDWARLYRANSNPFNDKNSAFVLYEDRNDDTQLTLNSILTIQANSHSTYTASIQYRSFNSDNFAHIVDLLGGTGYLDVDTFALDADKQQNDLQHPNRIARLGERFKYNYILTSTIFNGFVQAQFKYYKFDFFVAASLSNSTVQRKGLYQNGKFATANDSFGKSKKVDFFNMGFKAGATYKLTGRHLFNLNLGYRSKAPNLRNTFSNSRVNNHFVKDLTSEKIISAAASYVLRLPGILAKATGYYVGIKDASEVSFYYADGIGGSGSEHTAFVQEILTDIDKKHFGVELGIQAQLNPTIQLKVAANIGQYTYANNPTLTLKSEADGFQFDSRLAYLKDYKLATGPQQAYSLGFEYRDPNYWWVGATMNFFSNIYADVAPLTRTSNFSDNGGITFNDYDPNLAKQLLGQERFDAYRVVNLTAGKSWLINNHYIGLFVSVNNLLNTRYKTGGFEQGRNANFRELRDDKALSKPIFGNKYWYGRGTTYYLNLNFGF